MASEHQIVSVDSGPRQWGSRHGSQNNAWRCTLKTPDGSTVQNVEVSYKIGGDGNSKVPQPGDVLYGDIDHEANYGPKFKKQQQGGGYGGGGGGGGRSAWTPEREASVIRQHSQHMAVLTINGLMPQGAPLITDPTDDSEGAKQFRAMLRRLTNFFDADVQTAVEKAKQGGASGS